MPIEPVLCSQCGAPLEVPAEVQFVTCKQCGTALRVRHEATVTYTEAIEKISRQAEEISDHLAALRHEQALERIDREWQRERESLMVTSKHGRTYQPTVASGVIAMVLGGGFGLFWTIASASIVSRGFAGGPAMFFPLFGVVFIVLAIGLGLANIDKAQKYERAERSYRQRRAAAERRDRD